MSDVINRAKDLSILKAHPHPAIVALKIIASMGSDKIGWDAARIASVALKAMGEV
jgi:hypothetical protein